MKGIENEQGEWQRGKTEEEQREVRHEVRAKLKKDENIKDKEKERKRG